MSRVDSFDQHREMGQILLSEIREQPEAIRRTISSVDLTEIEPVLARPLKRVVLMGMGASFYAAMYGRYLFSQITGIQGEAYLASDYLYYPSRVDVDDLVILISQSGETVETTKVCRLLRDRGLNRILALTNTEGSTLTRTSNFSIITRAGIERASSTKTYLAALSILNLLSRLCAKSVNRMREDVDEAGGQIIDVADQLAKRMKDWDRLLDVIVEGFIEASTRFIISRGFNMSTAMIGSLLFKEATKIWVEACDGAEFRHEALELVRGGFTAVILAEGRTKHLSIRLATQIEKLEGTPIVTTCEDLGFDQWVSEDLTVFPFTVLLQMAAYSTSLKLGVNPDIFRSMRKVTLEE
jgi:glucosamine--fructose-6-phosphate aminotransferase (isomerizing)